MLLRKKLKYSVIQLGQLDRPQVENAVGLAQLVQDAFEFDFLAGRIDLTDEQYSLPNSGYDLDKAVAEIVVPKALPKPLILFTSLPYGDREYPNEPDCFYFSEDYPGPLFLVSTYLWDKIQPDTGLQPYILMMLASDRTANIRMNPIASIFRKTIQAHYSWSALTYGTRYNLTLGYSPIFS